MCVCVCRGVPRAQLSITVMPYLCVIQSHNENELRISTENPQNAKFAKTSSRQLQEAGDETFARLSLYRQVIPASALMGWVAGTHKPRQSAPSIGRFQRAVSFPFCVQIGW